MRVFVAIVGLFLLLPGLCGGVFLPMGLAQMNDPYVAIVFAFSLTGLVIGAVGGIMIWQMIKRVPVADRLRGWALFGHLALGLVGAGLALMGLSAVFSLLGIGTSLIFSMEDFGLDAGYLVGAVYGTLVNLAFGVAGGLALYHAARKLSGRAGLKVPEQPPAD